jgi:steroid delta-isomerase-like uncharacterized protein
MTTQEQNKAVVTEFIQAVFTKGDIDAFDRYVSSDFVDHDPPFGGAMKDGAAMIRAGFPDWRSELHLLVAEEDVVVEHFTASGTHQGEILGVLPTGKTLQLKGINMFRLRGGKIAERWGRIDELGFMAQLGVVDVPA